MHKMVWNTEIQAKYDEELNNVAASSISVTHPGYQNRLVNEIQDKNEELQSALTNPTGNKQIWLSEVETLKSELSALIEADNQIVIDNHESDTSYRAAWNAELAALKLNEDNQWVAVRNTRNWLLSLCDWTQLPDAPITDTKKTAWADYRQELRDIPETSQTIESIVWPAQPE